jgi:flagellar hook-associated protein 2
MAGLQLGGLISGMDTDTIISQLLAIDRAPETRWNYQKVAAQTRQTALRDVETRVKNLKLAAGDLGSTLLWTPTQSATSSDPAKLGARLTGGAPPGGYSLEVTQMATAAQQTFAWTPQAGASTIDVNGVTVNLAPGAGIGAAAEAINSTAQLGVFAIDIGNGQLVLSSRTTGTSSAFTATGAGLGAGPISQRAGQNAQLKLNGVAQPDQQSNVIATLIPGVELTLKGLTSSTMVDVSNPSVDRGTLAAKLKAFVGAYNDVVDLVSAKTSEKRVAAPTSNTEAAQGALFGDNGLRDMLSTMRMAIGSPVPGLTGEFALLSSIGLSTGATTGGGDTNADSVKGRLTLDETKLNAALDRDPLAVQRLLGGVTGSAGFSQAFKGLLDPLVTTNGELDQRIESAGKDVSRIADKVTALEARLVAREALLRKQFTAMEAALQRSQSQASDLAARLGSTS